jgi:RimJ/RimL family protein N-acetyltransferase
VPNSTTRGFLRSRAKNTGMNLTIETKRLLLREMRLSDAAALYEMDANQMFINTFE